MATTRRKKEDILSEIRVSKVAFADARKAVEAFRESADGKKLARARAKQAALDKAYEDSRSAYFEAYSEAAERLGIFRYTKDDDRVLTAAFAAAFAKTVGLTEDESRVMTGLNSLGGTRYDGLALYRHARQKAAEGIVEADPAVVAAEAAREHAYKVSNAHEKEEIEALAKAERAAEWAVNGAKRAIERLERELAEREEEARHREEEKTGGLDAKAAEEKAKAAAAKVRVLQVLRQYAYPKDKRRSTYLYGGKDPLPDTGLVVEWTGRVALRQVKG